MEQSAELVTHFSRAVAQRSLKGIEIGSTSEVVSCGSMHNFDRRPRSAIWHHSETAPRELPWRAHLGLGLGKPSQGKHAGSVLMVLGSQNIGRPVSATMKSTYV